MPKGRSRDIFAKRLNLVQDEEDTCVLQCMLLKSYGREVEIWKWLFEVARAGETSLINIRTDAYLRSRHCGVSVFSQRPWMDGWVNGSSSKGEILTSGHAVFCSSRSLETKLSVSIQAGRCPGCWR